MNQRKEIREEEIKRGSKQGPSPLPCWSEKYIEIVLEIPSISGAIYLDITHSDISLAHAPAPEAHLRFNFNTQLGVSVS